MCSARYLSGRPNGRSYAKNTTTSASIGTKISARLSQPRSTHLPVQKINSSEHVRLDFEAACREYGIEDTPHNYRVFAAGAAVSALTFDVYASHANMLPIGAETTKQAITMYVDHADTVANTPETPAATALG